MDVVGPPTGSGADRRPAVRRVLLVGASEDRGEVQDAVVARVGRAARDAGDEVVLLGSGVPVEVVAATALQEDVDAVLLAGGSTAYDERLTVALATLGADDVVVERAPAHDERP